MTFRTKLEGNEKRYKLSKIIIHEGYGKKVVHDSDIALAKLNIPAMVNTYVSPICLPNPYEQVPFGADCFVTGTFQNVVICSE